MSFDDPASTETTFAARRIDGRRLRSERTRVAIIEAYLELLRHDPRMPTAAQIADRAGFSVRSIFERFSDLNALTLATADYAIAQGQSESPARNVNSDRPTRIQTHVEIRARACEKWLPLWRILVMPDQVVELAGRIRLVRLANMARI